MTENQKVQPKISDTGADEEIDLVELAYTLLGKWKQIVAVTLCGALIAGIAAFWFVKPKYQATATIYVISRKDSEEVNMTDLQLGTALTADAEEVFGMWEVYTEVAKKLDLPYSYDTMQSMVTVSAASTSTRMLNIICTAGSAEEAAAIANMYAEVGSDYIAEKMAIERPSLMSSARVPTTPFSPNKKRFVLLGALLGFVVSCGAVTLLSLLNDTYKTTDDIKKYTGLATLAVIPVEHDENEQGRKKKMGLNLPGGKQL